MSLTPVLVSLPIFSGGTISPGVMNKARAKSAYLYREGQIRTIFLCPKGIELHIEDHQECFYYETDVVTGLEKLLQERRDILIFLRYPQASLRLLKVLTQFPNRLVFEHNTIEPLEWRLKLFSLTLRDLIYVLRTDPKRLWSEFSSPWLSELLWGAQILATALGGVCVCKCVAEDARRRCSGYLTTCVGNGIEPGEIEPLDVDLSGVRDEISLLFICGSPAPWTGSDRLLNSLLAYTGRTRFLVHFVGRFSSQTKRLARRLPPLHSAIFHGLKSREEIAAIGQSCQVGVGSLALHRIRMTSGSTLKVCEYVAMGLPLILGYNDTNLPIDYPYKLMFEASESLLDMDRISSFLANLRDNRFSSANMRVSSLHLVTMSEKAKQISDFLSELKVRAE